MLLYKLLLLPLDVELFLLVVCQGQIMNILHELLGDVIETLEPTRQQEEGLDVFLPPSQPRLSSDW
jgi:hypothetical protein